SERSSPCPAQRVASKIERQAIFGESSPGPPRGAANNRKFPPGRSSPYQLCSRRHSSEREEPYRRPSPYPLCNRLSYSERQEATGRTSPYHTRAGGVETVRSKRSRFRSYKRRSDKGQAEIRLGRIWNSSKPKYR
ncbi:hypothetical protein TNCT_482451, partial [Trichonephila clavata]